MIEDAFCFAGCNKDRRYLFQNVCALAGESVAGPHYTSTLDMEDDNAMDGVNYTGAAHTTSGMYLQYLQQALLSSI